MLASSLSYGFYSCDIMSERNLKNKRLFGLHTHITVHHWRKLKQEPGTWNWRRSRRHGGTQFINRLADHNLFILIAYTIQDNGLIGGNAHKGLWPSTLIICHENAPKDLPTSNLIGTYSWLMFPFPYNSNMTS